MEDCEALAKKVEELQAALAESQTEAESLRKALNDKTGEASRWYDRYSEKDKAQERLKEQIKSIAVLLDAIMA